MFKHATLFHAGKYACKKGKRAVQRGCRLFKGMFEYLNKLTTQNRIFFKQLYYVLWNNFPKIALCFQCFSVNYTQIDSMYICFQEKGLHILTFNKDVVLHQVHDKNNF